LTYAFRAEHSAVSGQQSAKTSFNTFCWKPKVDVLAFRFRHFKLQMSSGVRDVFFIAEKLCWIPLVGRTKGCIAEAGPFLFAFLVL